MRAQMKYAWKYSRNSNTIVSNGMILGEMIANEDPSLIVQLVKNPPAMQETPVWFLGREDPLEKGMATHSSILGLPWWLRR